MCAYNLTNRCTTITTGSCVQIGREPLGDMTWLPNSKLFTVSVWGYAGLPPCTAIVGERLTVLHRLPLTSALTWVPAMQMVMGIGEGCALQVWPAQSVGAALSWLSSLGAVVNQGQQDNKPSKCKCNAAYRGRLASCFAITLFCLFLDVLIGLQRSHQRRAGGKTLYGALQAAMSWSLVSLGSLRLWTELP